MKIGILTSGGDTPGMNAVIRACYIKAIALNHELIGIKYGWKGLLDNNFIPITDEIEDLIDVGGTLIKSGRTNPLNRDNGIELIKKNMLTNSIDCLIAIGGEDTLGVAQKLHENGIRIVGIPKTIDNDLTSTDYTFGFNTAISIATDAMDKLKTTARSHDRVIVIEIMGRHTGWMTLHSGIASGVHAILIPEFPLSMAQVEDIIKKRYTLGKNWALIAVSEGFGFQESNNETLETDEFGHVNLANMNISKRIAETLATNLSISTRAVVLGHIQRGGPPSAFDRVLCTQLGLKAVDLVNSKEFGKMPSLRGTKIESVKLVDAIKRLKTVDFRSWEVAKSIMKI